MMPGRRWSDGLHQAVEAKEGVKIERENQTLATITFQNYFRMYDKLAGMTGTADTEAAEFDQIYKLDVVVIPTNQPMIRDGPPGRRLPHGAREVGGRRRGDRRAAREGPAGARRHGLDREVGDVSRSCSRSARRPARRPQRQVPRAGGGDRRPGGPQGRRHDRHEHGRPRHRHPARRQPRGPGDARGRPGDPRPRSTPQRLAQLPRDAAPRSKKRSSRPAASTSSAPSATSRGASTTSCAAAPAARATPARRASSSRSRTT